MKNNNNKKKNKKKRAPDPPGYLRPNSFVPRAPKGTHAGEGSLASENVPKAIRRRVAVTPPGRPTRRPGDATAYMTLTPWIPLQRGVRVLPLPI